METQRIHSLDAMRAILMLLGVYFHLSIALEEERISALRPIEGLMDYYQQPFLGFIDLRNKKEHVVKWEGKKDRIKQLKKNQ